MADASDTLIHSQNARISQLEADKANLQAALNGERKARKADRTALAELQGKLTTAEAERDTARAAVTAAPDEKDKEIGWLKGELAGRDHRAAFDEAARGAGVKPENLDDLYELSGLKPGDAEPKAEDFAEFLAGAKAARGWAFGDVATDAGGTSGAKGGTAALGTQGIRLGATAPPPGAGRGASDHTSGLFTVRRGDARNPLWMRDNGAALARAQSEGRLRWAD